MTLPKWMKSSLEQQHILYVIYSQYHACWCSRDFRSQCIGRHSINPQSRITPSVASDELIDIGIIDEYGNADQRCTHCCASATKLITWCLHPSLCNHSCKYTGDHVRYMTAHSALTHWGRVTHICVGNLTIIGSDNGLSPVRRQAIIWTNDGLLLVEPLGTKLSENSIEIIIFSFKKMRLKCRLRNGSHFVSA